MPDAGCQMSERRFLVLDIETIIDWDLVRQVFDLDRGASADQAREQLLTKYPTGFPPPPFQIPICIALIDVDYDSCKVLNATVLESSDEKTLLQLFWKVIRRRKGSPVRTTLVHFNGRGFDLPVLFHRSLKHRVPVVTWDRSRYSFEASHDVCDDLSDFGAASRPSLDVVAKMLGLAGKTDMKGHQVEELYRQGEKARIMNYCMEDALNTYFVWLTIRLIRNEITEEKYREAFGSAAETVRNSRTVTDTFFTTP